jgi:hypothetical protein
MLPGTHSLDKHRVGMMLQWHWLITKFCTVATSSNVATLATL